jgi:hypothetical protein
MRLGTRTFVRFAVSHAKKKFHPPERRRLMMNCDNIKGVENGEKKDQWDLLPLYLLKPVIRVLMLGANKYAPFAWQKVVRENPTLYFDACIRHLSAWQEDEKDDKESGYSHLAHAICCLIFLLWNETK